MSPLPDPAKRLADMERDETRASRERIVALEAENARLEEQLRLANIDAVSNEAEANELRARSARLAAACGAAYRAAREPHGEWQDALLNKAMPLLRAALADAPTGRWVADEVVKAAVNEIIDELSGAAWANLTHQRDILRAAGLLDEEPAA